MTRLHKLGASSLTEGSLMGSGPVGDLKRDILTSFVISIAGFSALFFVGTPLVALDNIDAINRTITTILGLLFPVLAIVYTFGFRDENKAIRELKRVGKFEEVVNIFSLSIASIGLIWIFTFSISVFQLHNLFGYVVQLGFAYTAIFAFIFVILRLWRCYQVFLLLNKAIKANE